MGSNKLQASDSEAWFRTLLNSAPDAMIIVDANGQIEVVNRQAEIMFGYSREELQGRGIEILLPEPLQAQHVAHRRGYANNPGVRPMGSGLELFAKRKDGSEFPVEISLSPVQMESASFVSSVIRDVTERKKMEQEIIAAKQAAERANKANSAFLAAASHDLRQPVQALSLLNGALRRTVKDARALEMIASQENSLTAMTNLLNSLLDISRLDAGAITPELEEFPMQRMIDRLSAEFARQAQQKGLKFSAQSCKAIVRSDPNLLSEIIQNLVSNAIRYTKKGAVTLRCIETDGCCSVQVEDTGVGIEKDQLEAIFKEFHQVKTPGSNKEGFGLGLAIVRRLADLLRHRIEVQSTPGSGSCFSVALPVIQSHVARVSVGDPSDAAHAGEASGLVMLIEDDTSVANAWALLLEAEGYDVATCASVAETRALIRHLQEAPALIISDFHLQDKSTGVEAVAAVRQFFNTSVPCFIVSGDTSKIVKDARLLENCTVMSKPVNTSRLLLAAKSATRTGLVPDD
ncbi:MAG: PAS domain S-box protein [Gammaproteobacteria bacterium]|nr:PAS domain S-box protein [Gammaproteobacteria bacterium]MDH5302674.1 PAS domain S-box protein [Gammaproteobacteria bacterium]MDH5320889.1 PAS domain S-box protein [Gammaproteobacteria bacterium]